MAIINFDASQVQPSVPFEVIPTGDYVVMIVDSQMKPTSDGNGQYLQLQLQVIDGNRKGATLFDRLNMVNRNQQTMEIAQRTLSAVCHAVGVLQVQDSTQLHNRPLIARVVYKEPEPKKDGSGMWDAKNEIKGYKPIAAATAAPAASPAQTAAAPVFQAPATLHQQAAPVPASNMAQPWLAGKVA